MNLLFLFYEEIIRHLTKCDDVNQNSLQKLIKLQERDCFDFQFPVSLKIWRNYMKLNEDEAENYRDSILLYSIDETSESSVETSIRTLKNESKKWTFTIENVELVDGRCSFTIDRASSYSRVLREISENPSYGISDKMEDETMNLISEGEETSTVTQFRVQLVTDVINRLIPFSRFTLLSDSSAAKYKIFITSKSKLCKDDENTSRTLLTCGPVINPADKKISTLSTDDYIKRRREDMHLISIHKYGMRVKSDETLNNMMTRLGRNAATLDLLEVKQSAAVTLSSDPKQAFILYNSARIETLMEKFRQKVEEGYYMNVPGAHEIDTSLLQEVEEWKLFKLLLTFPDVLERAVNELPQGRVNIHFVHKHLSELASVFSVYYRRVRLLTENRAQLMPVLHAKIYFLRCLQKIFNETLGIFSIDPVAFM